MRQTIHCWLFLHLSSLLLLSLDTEGEDCSSVILVRRNTSYDASVGTKLQITCPFTTCNISTPVFWYYIVNGESVPVNFSSNTHIKTDRIMLNDLNGTAYLVFENIQRKDSGLYHCQIEYSRGHKMKVSVYGDIESTNDTEENETNSSQPFDAFTFLYCAAGILGIVAMVIIISFISMQVFHQNVQKPKKETKTDKQCIEMSMVEQPFPSPRASPAPPPSRRLTRKQKPPSQPVESPGDVVYGQIIHSDDRRRDVEVEEAASSLVYAALNHALPPRAAARPRVNVEETSEYAAIRVP